MDDSIYGLFMKFSSVIFFLFLAGLCWGVEYKIRSVDFIIDGRSKEYTIRSYLSDIVVGKSFESEDDFLDFILEQKQRLASERTIGRSHIVHTLEVLGDVYQIDITIYVYDTWNVIPLPYFKYDDNDGLTLSLRLRDYNTFGQQGYMALDFDYDYKSVAGGTWNHGARFNFKLDSPIKIIDQKFDLLLQQKIEYYLSQGVTSDTIAGMQYNLNLEDHVLYLGYHQQIFYSNDAQAGYEDAFYGQSYPFIGARIDVGVSAPFFGSFWYEPQIAVRMHYNFENKKLSEAKQGVRLEFKNVFTLGSHMWIDNFRQGMELQLDNFNWYKPESNVKNFWDVENQLSFTGFWKVAPIVHISHRSIIRYAPNSGIEKPGKYLRGVLNKGVFKDSGQLAFFLNNDLTILLFKAEPAFEAHMSFFFDFGIVYDYNQSFDLLQDIQYAVGIEGILFPIFAKSFFMRMSFGLNLNSIIKSGEENGWQRFWSSRELFIGVGHHF